MLNCIKNALDHGYLTQNQADDLQSRVDARLKPGVYMQEVRERLADELVREMREGRRRAMLQEVRRVVLTEQVLQHRNVKGQRDPAEALWMLIEHFGEGKGIDDAETRKWVILREAHADLAQFLFEFRKGAIKGDLRRQSPELVARMDNIVRELFGEKTGDARAATLATGWAATAEKLRKRANEGGMFIQKLEGWALPQAHSPEALISIGQEAWVDYLMQPGVLDRAKMKSWLMDEVLDDDTLRTALRAVWREITTDGWVQREATFQAFGKGSLAKRRNDHHRFLHFANADAWIDYHRNFKAGDPFEGMLAHLSVMARDIATIETFGPNPEAMRNYLKQLVLRDAAKSVPQRTEVAFARAKALGVIDRVVPGDRAKGFIERIEKIMEEASDLARRGRAQDSEDLLKQARERSAGVQKIEDEIMQLEPIRIGQQRADLVAQINRAKAEIVNVEAKSAPQLGGRLSRRNQAKLERAQETQARLEADLEKLDASDTRLVMTEPEAVQQLMDAFDQLKSEVRALNDGTYARSRNPVDDAKSAIYRHDKMWDVFRGNHYAPINSNFANVAQSSRNIATSAMLGSAAITSLADLVNAGLARRMSGMSVNPLRLIGDYIAQIRTDKVAAMEAGLMLDSMVHIMHQQARYLDAAGFMGQSAETMGKKAVQWSGFLGDRVVGITGMSWLTQAGKWAHGTAMQVEMGKLKGVQFDNLPPMVKRMFDRHGIDEKTWNTMRQAQLYQPQKGLAYLRPAEIEKLAGGREAFEKYLAMIHRETRFAVVENTVRSRSFVGSERRGTFWGEMQLSTMQFKSFGLVHTIMNIGRVVREFQAGHTGNALMMTAGMVIGGALIGAIINELHNIVNGVDPVINHHIAKGEAPGATYWGKALLRAGGLGIVGDVVFAPVGIFGGLGEVLMGPVLGTVETARKGTLGDALDWYEDKYKEGKASRKALAFVNKVTPGSTIWYLKLLKNRLILNQLQLATDPHAREVFRRQETLMRKNDGRVFWWRPGETTPGRTPMFVPDKDVAERSTAKTLTSRERTRLEREGKELPAPEGPTLKVGQSLAATAAAPFTVMDGDTIRTADGKRWRIEGYDAPEVYSKAKPSERAAGMQAALRLQDLLRSGKAEIVVSNAPDRWGRGRARLLIDGKDVSAIMKREGHTKFERAR